MENSKPLLLVHKGMSTSRSSATINIMLSPQFYTMKREELPVKYLYQAKRLAPSILENLLSEGREHHYHVYKDGDAWVFIAYDPLEIAQFLDTKGIKPEQVAKVFFAQQYAQKFDKPFLLTETELISKIQDTVVVLPTALMNETIRYQMLDESVNSSDGIPFNFNSSALINQKEAIIIASILTLFTLMFTVEGLRYKGIINTMQEEVGVILEEHPSLQSQYARDNIAKKYRTIDKEERNKRDILKKLSSFITPGAEVVLLSMDSKKFMTEIKFPDEKRLLQVKSLASRSKYKSSRLGNASVLKIEGEL